MKKIVICILVVALCVGVVLLASSVIPELAEKVALRRVIAAMEAKYGAGVGVEDMIYRYYGTYNGYDVFFSQARANLAVVGRITIADMEFSDGNPFLLIACKGGNIYQLNELYDQGVFTDEVIEKIHQKHIDWKEQPRKAG